MRNYLTLLLLFVFSLTANAQVIWKDGNYASFLPKKGFYLFDGKFYSSLTVDPSAGAGVVAGIGSLGVRDNAGAGEIWLKSAAANTAWNSVLTTGTGWALLGNAGTTAGTNFLGTTDAQDLYVKTNGFTQLVFDKDGGFYAGQFSTPVDGVGENRYLLSSIAIPTVSTTTSDLVNFNSDFGYDSGNTGFNSGSLIATKNRMSLYGSGTVNYAGIVSNQFSTANLAGTTTLFKGNDTNTGVGDGYTITDLYNVTSYVNVGVGSTIGNASLFNSGITLTDSIATNIFNLSSNLQVTGTSVVSGALQGTASSLTSRDSSSVDQLVGANYSTSSIDTTTTNGVTGVIVNSSLSNSAADANGLQGIAIDTSQSGASTSGYVTTIQAQAQLSNTSSTVGVTVLNAGSSIRDTANAGNFTAINANPQIQDSATASGFTIGSFAGNIQDSSTVANLNGVTISPILKNTATATNFTALGIFPQVLDTATVTNPLTLINMNFNTVPAVPGITGIQLSLTGTNVADFTQKNLIQADGGKFSFAYGYSVPAAVPFIGTNNISDNPTVDLGTPISSLHLSTNVSSTVTFNDDWTADFTTARLGFVPLAVAGQIIGSAGKTMDAYTGFVSTVSNPSGAGTLSKYTGVRVGGISPAGGTLAVTDAYAFYADNGIGGFSATNNYGIYLDLPTASTNNFLGGKTRFNGATYVAPTESVDVTGSVRTDTSLMLEDPGAGTFKTVVQAATLAADWTLTLPVDDGAANQALITDGAGVTSWSTVAISPLTTKGDIWVYSTLDTRLPVGANGEVLTADSGAAEGVSWQALPGVGTPTVETQVADFTVTKDVSLVDASGGPVVATLPSAAVIRYIHIKKIDLSANAVTLAAAGGDTVEDDLTLTITDGKVTITLVSDGGTAWHAL